MCVTIVNQLLESKLKIYIAFCQDRHLDPEIKAFRLRGDAIIFAQEYMVSHVGYPDDLHYEDTGILYCINYGDEEDHAYVFESELL